MARPGLSEKVVFEGSEGAVHGAAGVGGRDIQAEGSARAKILRVRVGLGSLTNHEVARWPD